MSRLITLSERQLSKFPMANLAAYALAVGANARGRMDAATAKAALECVVPSDDALRHAVQRAWPEECRLDAGFSVAFTDELKHVFTEVSKQPMPEYPFANGDVLPFDTSVALGKKLYEYRMLSYSGHAEVLASYAWRKLPTVSVAGDARVGKVERFGCAWTITEDDELAQAHTQIQLDRELPLSAKRAHLQLWDRGMAFGLPSSGLTGAMNHPNMPVIDAPLNGGSTSTYWVNKTGDEIIDDVRLLLRHLPSLTNEMEHPDVVYMSPAEMSLITVRKMPDANGVTVFEYMKKAFPKVEFKELNACRSDLSYGNLDTNCLWAVTRNKAKSCIVVVEPYRQREPIVDGLEKVVICTSGHGGSLIRYPYSLVRMDGVGLGG
ncbi:MAG: DUF2184 domain-containing protein [Myxococcales bacterium]|nr:DUF2184 domain-containing protein [Myxococcales bacterium]